MNWLKITVSCLSLSVNLWLIQMASAQIATSTPPQPIFHANHILDDRDLFEWHQMNREHIQRFLLRHGTLGQYRTRDIDGSERLAADIIWRIANSYKISPQYLLALMQKEQSLIEDQHPTQKQFDWATGYGICDRCSMNDPALQQYKGFASQLEWAAKQHREKYLLQILGRGTTIAGYAPGRPALIDGQTITPDNQATAMLYTYTPHLHGNVNLWNIWKRWFALRFPEGSVVRGKTSQQVFSIRLGERRPFKNAAVLNSIVNPKRIVDVEDSQLSHYPIGPSLSFPNYALVETPAHKRYLIVDDKKRLIQNQQAFDRVGFSADDLIPADPEDLAGYADGEPISAKTGYPIGILAKDAQGRPWYVENAVKHPIPNQLLIKLYFPGIPFQRLTRRALAKLTPGEPYRLKDAELVRSKNDPTVYVIENGSRRPIPGQEVFQQMGWQEKNILTFPASFLETYPIGPNVDPTLPVELAQGASTSSHSLASASSGK